MAFVHRDLSVLAYANGFTFWQYRSADDGLAAIAASGYFDGAATQLRVGDVVAVLDDADEVAFLRVSGNAEGVVTTGGTRTVTPAAVIDDPSGGGTQDAQARTAIGAIVDALQAAGIVATA